ncbi:MAG: hypothetical protein AAFZ07_09680 [Actinomycetota bacterium]
MGRRTIAIVVAALVAGFALGALLTGGDDEAAPPDRAPGPATTAPEPPTPPATTSSTLAPTTTQAPPPSFCAETTWAADAAPAPDRLTVVETDLVLDCDVTVGALRIAAGASLTFVGDAELVLDAGGGRQASGRLEVMGALRMRPTDGEQHTITFRGLDAGEMIGGDDGMMSDPGGLHAMGEGVLDLDGPDRTAWTRLAAPAREGDRSIVVEAADGWQPGDVLTVVPSLPPDDPDFATAYSEATIVEVADGVVTLDRPLAHDAPEVEGRDGAMHRAEVLNLTRDVVIRTTTGDPSYVTLHPGSGRQHLADVGLIGLGPAEVIGRYPIHLHLLGDGSRGSTFDRLLVLDSQNRAVVPHGSHGTTWTDVVAHRIANDAFWWDRGQDANASDDTTWHRLVASQVTDSEESRFRLAGFQLGSGTGNTMTESVAVGVQGAKDSAGIAWPEGAGGRGSGEWAFDANVSHNNARHGVFTWQNTSGAHEITDLVSWHNGAFGVSHGAYRNGYLWDGLDLIGNADGGLLLHAVSREPDLRFVDLWIRGGEFGIRTTRHNQPVIGPTVIDGLIIEDVEVALWGAATGHPDSIDVHGYDGPPVEYADVAHRASEWRFHATDGTVTAVTP